MARRGKQYRIAREKIDPLKRYSFQEAVQLAAECKFAKFDETVDIAVRLGVDPRHADQMVRGTVVLPNGLGKTVRVLVFAKGEKVKEALDAGADHAGGDELVDKTTGRPSTFFGEGIVGHVGFAPPFCAGMRETVGSVLAAHCVRHLTTGTYICMEGPAFSTPAESSLHRSWNAQVPVL